MTHLPTGKFYIGSLQRAHLWNKYKTSSKIVIAMISESPDEWRREILKQYTSEYDPQVLVTEEYSLIDEAVQKVGWEGIWNQRGSNNLGSSGYSPVSREKQKASARNPEVIVKSKLGKKAFLEANPDFYDRMSANLKDVWSTPEMRNFASKRAIEQFSNLEKRKVAAKIKKEYLANHPEDVEKSLIGMKNAREDLDKENNRKSKIKITMASKSELFSQREKKKYANNPELGKKHGEKLRLLNKIDPSRQQRMSASAKRKIESRPDLVEKSVSAMNSQASRDKMKMSLLAKYGKWVNVVFSDGTELKILGAKEAGRILGIDKVSRKVTQNKFNKPVLCTSTEYFNREVVSVKYIDE